MPPKQPIIINLEDPIDEIQPATSSNPHTDDNTIHNELAQPYVDIHALFNHYNQKHFGNRIRQTYVEYSTRMTLCAGTCTFKGRVGGCRIALSEPLLKFRPRRDLLSTLLHEMIHAYLFETEGVRARDGVDGHGPKFMSHANRINGVEGGRVEITAYHTFGDEVELYRVHHWECCRCKRVIKRAMNRAPGPNDLFWGGHVRKCGGSFVKIKEPEKTKKTKGKGAAKGAGKGRRGSKRIDVLLSSMKNGPRMVPCPVCNVQVEQGELNAHLDMCLLPGVLSTPENSVQFVPASSDEDEAGGGGGGGEPSSNKTRQKRKRQADAQQSPNRAKRAHLLTSLAIDPWSVSEDQVIQILDSPPPPRPPPTPQRIQLATLLQPVLDPVQPSSNAVARQRKAEAHLSTMLRNTTPQTRPASRRKPQEEQPRCPVCNIQVARAQLEAHVNACMASTGLDEAFLNL